MKIVATKLVLETLSPMAINSGLREFGFDSELVRDINGLPMLPATAFAGQLSHHCEKHLGTEMKEKWFGTTVQASTLSISNGTLLDSSNTPVRNFISQEEISRDPLLSLCVLERPHHRERVAINDRGVARDTGKFDQILLPAGVRFEVSLHWSDQSREDGRKLNVDEWHQLLSLIDLRTFALGSSTRNGLGNIAIIESTEQEFDLLGNQDEAERFAQFRSSVRPHEHQLKQQLDQTRPAFQPYRSITLKALDNWRCGSGVNLLRKEQTSKHYEDYSPDILTYSEPSIIWKNDKAEVSEPKAVLCGSSIKGMLAHRLAFHLNRHTNRWAETLGEAKHDQWQSKPEQLKELLGDSDDKHQNSLAGILYVDDALLNYEHTTLRFHNSIDRFTGGVRQGALYSEELLYQPEFTINLYLTEPYETLEEPLKFALENTIEDLELGLLPMGAGSGRGTSLVMAKALQEEA
ncbi:RAMP superfamily CRISPR-associated protein [Vibrio sp. MarTm2]|uniref:RAMP superfamily CRISPR-associated protein n=1 Tax=Vibrio sp. MarTm2 TaxID=2998831 RepID=UPI0022CDB566|nr:RAMP superfamily CRISPR-associated protein [Vibrio sp. MarTm2]MDA0129454.1 RAMP superfamily CRISPR-associated protein [Vibrio sp. MarTm2]